MLRASYQLVYADNFMIYLRDENRMMTVTNDAEAVIADLDAAVTIGGRRVFYKDSMGDISELVVKNGIFDGFKCCDGEELQAIFESALTADNDDWFNEVEREQWMLEFNTSPAIDDKQTHAPFIKKAP